jgi:hypothetical protein
MSKEGNIIEINHRVEGGTPESDKDAAYTIAEMLLASGAIKIWDVGGRNAVTGSIEKGQVFRMYQIKVINPK